MAQIKVKKGHVVYPGAFLIPRELFYPELSLSNVVCANFIEIQSDAAILSELGFFFIQSRLIRQLGQSRNSWGWVVVAGFW